jgi:hypothetical protein
MLRRTGTVEAWRRAFPLAVLLLLGGCDRWSGNSAPCIVFTKVPAADVGGPDKLGTIEGRAPGARPGQQIVLYAKSEELWWVQPVGDHPFTKIEDDSKWKSQIHLGPEYAALLVQPGYNPPETAETLPGRGGGIEAVAVINGPGPAPAPIPPKMIHFSGYDWIVRSAASNRAGTRNSFDPANAWTDERGALHLRITRGQGKWICAEIKLARTLGYGTYRFVVRDTSQLEPSAVLTLLTWDGLGTEQNRRELDVEISRWGYRENENAHYVVQPYFIPANIVRFRVPGGGAYPFVPVGTRPSNFLDCSGVS